VTQHSDSWQRALHHVPRQRCRVRGAARERGVPKGKAPALLGTLAVESCGGDVVALITRWILESTADLGGVRLVGERSARRSFVC
jgi:hypothetical protein